MLYLAVTISRKGFPSWPRRLAGQKSGIFTYSESGSLPFNIHVVKICSNSFTTATDTALLKVVMLAVEE